MILVTRPNDDQGLNYLYCWSSLVVDEAFNHGFGVTDLSGKKANRKKFVSYYNKHHHKLVFLNGHGYDNLITGYGGEILVDDSKNKFNMPGSIIEYDCNFFA